MMAKGISYSLAPLISLLSLAGAFATNLAVPLIMGAERFGQVQQILVLSFMLQGFAEPVIFGVLIRNNGDSNAKIKLLFSAIGYLIISISFLYIFNSRDFYLVVPYLFFSILTTFIVGMYYSNSRFIFVVFYQVSLIIGVIIGSALSAIMGDSKWYVISMIFTHICFSTMALMHSKTTESSLILLIRNFDRRNLIWTSLIESYKYIGSYWQYLVSKIFYLSLTSICMLFAVFNDFSQSYIASLKIVLSLVGFSLMAVPINQYASAVIFKKSHGRNMRVVALGLLAYGIVLAIFCYFVSPIVLKYVLKVEVRALDFWQFFAAIPFILFVQYIPFLATAVDKMASVKYFGVWCIVTLSANEVLGLGYGYLISAILSALIIGRVFIRA